MRTDHAIPARRGTLIGAWIFSQTAVFAFNPVAELRGQTHATVTVLSEPSGAEIVVDERKAGKAPVTAHYTRHNGFEDPTSITVTASTKVPGLCNQALYVPPSQAVPDTVRFDMHDCEVRPLAIHVPGQLDAVPVRLTKLPLNYPDMLLSDGIQGSAVVEITIDTAGHPEEESIVLLRATHKLFAEEAEKAALGSRFMPGRVKGTPVRTVIQIPIKFHIRGCEQIPEGIHCPATNDRLKRL